MATRDKDGLHGRFRDRTQYHNEETNTYTVRDETGKFMRGKQGSPYKRIRKEWLLIIIIRSFNKSIGDYQNFHHHFLILYSMEAASYSIYRFLE